MMNLTKSLREKLKTGASSLWRHLLFVIKIVCLDFFWPRLKSSNAEDLMQETFVKAYRKIHRFNPKYAFSTWLFTIANRLAVSAWRKYKPTVDEIPEITDSAPCPATQTERDDNRENLWELARIALNDTQYTALWLHYGEDLSIVEIAQTLRRTQTGVKVLLHRARKNWQSLTPTTRANQNSDLTFQPNATQR